LFYTAFSHAQGFYLRAVEHDPGFIFLQNEIIMVCFFIIGDQLCLCLCHFRLLTRFRLCTCFLSFFIIPHLGFTDVPSHASSKFTVRCTLSAPVTRTPTVCPSL